ncbi:MAG: epoxyqueuosine reductase QueH [Bacilli bacterium]|nr:epoxyqueuosine reductase QueH [Bacilli bacterium]MBN2696419.1 epoxyqueuosine reductase QueH [Bacilli bacterium]
MKILLHICCAPCSVMSIEALRQEGHDVTGFWYNPNIHPVTEFRNRLNTLKTYAASIELPLIVDEYYGLRMFVENVVDKLDTRCEFCYEERLKKTAIRAKAEGFDAFTSTLFISPYQQHEKLKEIAERVADETKIAFHYVDFRPFFREGQKKARELDFYMQKYCGCIFSEEERYLKLKKN